MLNLQEESLFSRLSVFAGGCTLEAAEAVCAGAPLGKEEVLPLLMSLTDKSLVVYECRDGEDRYRMLEAIRQFAQEEHEKSDQVSDIRDRHLFFYVSQVETSGPTLVAPDAHQRVMRLDRDLENVLAAHDWCGRSDERSDIGLRLVAAVDLYWLVRGRFELGYRVTLDALRRRGTGETAKARGKALFAAGMLGYYLGHDEEAEKLLRESLLVESNCATSNWTVTADSMLLLGMVLHARGEIAASCEQYNQLRTLAQDRGDKQALSRALHGLAELDRSQGELGNAESLYRQSLALDRQCGDRNNTVAGLLNLSMVAVARESDDIARGMLLEALGLLSETGSARLAQGALEVSAGLAVSMGEYQRAARIWGASEAQRERMRLRREPADEAFLSPLIARSRRAVPDETFHAAEIAGRNLTLDEVLKEVRAWLDLK